MFILFKKKNSEDLLLKVEVYMEVAQIHRENKDIEKSRAGMNCESQQNIIYKNRWHKYGQKGTSKILGNPKQTANNFRISIYYNLPNFNLHSLLRC